MAIDFIMSASNGNVWVCDECGATYNLPTYNCNCSATTQCDTPSNAGDVREDSEELTGGVVGDVAEVPKPVTLFDRVMREQAVAGGSTPHQYGIPKDAKDLQDLIEYREMNFALGNIFKACYRQGTCDHSDELRDMNKIIWFAQREVKRLINEG